MYNRKIKAVKLAAKMLLTATVAAGAVAAGTVPASADSSPFTSGSSAFHSANDANTAAAGRCKDMGYQGVVILSDKLVETPGFYPMWVVRYRCLDEAKGQPEHRPRR